MRQLISGRIAPFFAVGMLLFGIYACGNDPADIEAYMDKLKTGEERAEDVEILYSDSALVKVRITGHEMITSLEQQKPTQRFTQGVLVEFFDPRQKISSTLYGNYAIREEKNGKIFIRDSVVWQSIGGDKLETEELVWDERKKMVYSDRFVVITRPTEKIWGQGFEADQDFTNAKINAVEGRVTRGEY